MGARINRTDGGERAEAPEPDVEPDVDVDAADGGYIPEAPRGPGILRTRKQRPERGALNPTNHLPFVIVWTGAYIATDAGPAPDLRTQSLINGVAGVHQLRDGDFETDGLEFNCGQAGHVPLLDIHHEYCVKIPGHDGCWGYPWSRVERGSLMVDEAMYAKWRASLTDRRIIPEPTVSDLRGILANIDRQIGSRSGTPADILATLDNRRALIVAALERLET